MDFASQILASPRPESIRAVALPRRAKAHPSPADWREEIIYFLLPDRFSDGEEASRPLVDPANPGASRPDGFRWDQWSASGGGRYQGGTLRGLRSKLDYIAGLGATTLWIAPVLKQRTHWDSYHGYAFQDLLEVDPRLGTRQELVDLVAAAHTKNLRVLLDVVFNHSAENWFYTPEAGEPPAYRPWPGFYLRGLWLDGEGNSTAAIQTDDDGVWPRELWPEDYYTRAGQGDLGAGNINDPHAEFRRTDFFGDRDINYDQAGVLDDIARCYKYWIALTDCDGFRIDTLKHIDQESGRNLCGSIKEFAASLGKLDFFLVGEVAGADSDADLYLRVLGSNLNATLDIGQIRPTLVSVAKGLTPPSVYFEMMSAWNDDLGSHRNSGKRRVSVLDDHDCVSGTKTRFSADAPTNRQVVAGVAIQLFTLGIPCIYYGTEQAFAGPEANQRQYLTNYGGNDAYLREAMFGPGHPRRSGLEGLPTSADNLDLSMPGFGPFGTSGAHCFNPAAPTYVRIAHLAMVRAQYPALRYGRQYQRAISNFGADFALPDAGELIAWSRVLDDEELLCVVNGNGSAARGGDVAVDPALNQALAPGDPWRGAAPFFIVVANSAQAAAGGSYNGSHPVGSQVPVTMNNGIASVALRNLAASEVLVLTNRP